MKASPRPAASRFSARAAQARDHLGAEALARLPILVSGAFSGITTVAGSPATIAARGLRLPLPGRRAITPLRGRPRRERGVDLGWRRAA